MKTKVGGNRNSGVTLLELLVSITVGMILIVVMALMTASASRWSTNMHSDLSTRRNGKMALDYFGRDISAVTAAESGRSTLVLVPEKVAGPGELKACSFWVMLLSRPASSSNQGAIRTVSYRLVYTDPMTPNGSYPRFALYRTVVTPEPGSDNSFLSVSNLHADYWMEKWKDNLGKDSGRAILDDYLLENVVDVKVAVNYTYYNAAGRKMSGSKILEQETSWNSEGFAGGGIPSDHTPNVPLSIRFTLTVLNAHGVSLYESGTSSLDEIILKESITANRTFPLLTR